MAWLIGDGFDFYNAATDITLPGTIWTAAGSASLSLTTTTRFSAGISNILVNGTILPSVSFANSATLWVNFAFTPNIALAGTTAQVYGFDLKDGASIQCGVYIRADGSIVLTSNGLAGTVLATSPVGIATTAGIWYHFQFKIVIHNTAGSIEMRLNGHTVDDWNATSLNTRNGTATAQVNAITWKGAANNALIDDFYMFNDQGAAPNTWQGDVRAVQLMPSSDSSIQWTPNSGANNFSRTSELREDGDTSYVSTNTATNTDLYGTASLSTTPIAIVAVQTKMIARMDDAGPHTVKSRLRSSGTDSDSANLSCSSSYQWIWQNYATDPNTSATWAASAVNSATIGPVDVV